MHFSIVQNHSNVCAKLSPHMYDLANQRAMSYKSWLKVGLQWPTSVRKKLTHIQTHISQEGALQVNYTNKVRRTRYPSEMYFKNVKKKRMSQKPAVSRLQLFRISRQEL